MSLEFISGIPTNIDPLILFQAGQEGQAPQRRSSICGRGIGSASSVGSASSGCSRSIDCISDGGDVGSRICNTRAQNVHAGRYASTTEHGEQGNMREVHRIATGLQINIGSPCAQAFWAQGCIRFSLHLKRICLRGDRVASVAGRHFLMPARLTVVPARAALACRAEQHFASAGPARDARLGPAGTGSTARHLKTKTGTCRPGFGYSFDVKRSTISRFPTAVGPLPGASRSAAFRLTSRGGSTSSGLEGTDGERSRFSRR